MTSPIRPLQLGSLQLPINVFYAPLAGCSDYPFRQMAVPYKPGLMYCEMVKMEALLRRNEGTLRLLDYDPTMHPIGAQLCGSNPALAGPAAKIVEDMGFDTVDLNCGCPVDKVTKDGSGSGLLKDLDRIGEIVSNMVAAVRIPVTIKVRAGWDDDRLVVPQVVAVAEQAGAVAITIHGRTREQGYCGNARWEWIRWCKEAARTIKVIGNGDLFSADDVRRMFEEVGCDGVLISRGTMGGPWIVDDVRRLFAGEEIHPRGTDALRQALLQHLEYIVKYAPERRALLDLRRVGCWYAKGWPNVREFRAKLCATTTVQEVRDLLTAWGG